MTATSSTRAADSTLPVRRGEALPDFSQLSYAEIARGTGISPSMLSRMFSDDPEQRRANPTLNTLIALRAYLEQRTGHRVSLDALVDAIT